MRDGGGTSDWDDIVGGDHVAGHTDAEGDVCPANDRLSTVTERNAVPGSKQDEPSYCCEESEHERRRCESVVAEREDSEDGHISVYERWIL